MPPKKPPASSQSQKSLVAVPAAAYERKPTPLPSVPDAASIAPLWVPSSPPKPLFPEWPSAAVLAAEHWGSDDALYDDPAPPTGFLAPGREASVSWKRPSEFLPVIAEPAPPPVALPPVAADPKHAAAAKKAAPPPAKKGEPEPPKKPKPPRYAHIVHVEHDHHGSSTHHHGHAPVAVPPADPKKPVTATASHPSTPAVVAPPQPPPRRILHDFRRLWSAEQQEDLASWRLEEERIAKDKEHRERVYMEFEDAIAFIINGRPRTLNEDDVKAEDLEDDGEDDDEQADDGIAAADSSPYGGFLPPATIDISANAIVKPEIPHGDVVQPAFASYFRIVDQLHQHWSTSPESSTATIPYLWEAIHPQDAQGVPHYNPAGKWRRVDVDDKFPVDADGNIQVVASSMKNELWPSILAKALIKVASFIGVEDASDAVESHDTATKAIESVRLASLVITALTGWKVTRHDSAPVFAGNFQSLQEYVPQTQPSEAQNELALDVLDENPSETVEQASNEATKAAQEMPHPRAVICSTVARGPQNLAFRETALLVEVVGEAENLHLKIVNLNGPTSIKEEELSADTATILIVHPPQRYADLLLETWSIDADGVAEPFPNPTTQFCVISSMMKAASQPAGDESAENAPLQSDLVNVLVTLNRIPPSISGDAKRETSNAQTAKHLGVDPRGSVLLVEDLELEKYRFRLSGQLHRARRPLVFKIDTCSTALLQLPRGEFETMAFRAYPQPTLRFGYSLLVEGDVKVDWQTSNTYWRNVWDLQVIEAEGAFPAMLPASWNILFKQSIELAAPTEDASNSSTASPEIHVDLHLSDPEIAPYVRVSIVNQQGDHVVPLSGLHGGTTLPHEAATYTLVVECRPRKQIPEGKWHLRLASNRFFKHAAIHQPRLTIFSGVYTPNKPLVCLRDVMQHPKKTTSTSLQFELLDANLNTVHDLAADLQVIDLATGQPLGHYSRPGLIHLLQMPPYTKGTDDPNEEKSGYIIQCGVDKTTCHVPAWIQSVRPFVNKQSEPPKEKPIEETHEAQEPTDAPVTNQLELKWRLLCWSVDEVKLEFDRTQELRFEAIRAGWAEAAKDRDAHGASSRLLFLGKLDAAASAMADDSLSEEQIAKYKARAEWLREARTRVAGLADSDHIDVQPELPREAEVVRDPDDLVRDHERYQAMTDETNAFLQSIRDDRAIAKETRGPALKDQVQLFIDERKEAEKLRHELNAQRDKVRAEIQAAATAGAAG